MGYTTDFEGEFKLDKPLTDEHAAYLRAFADTRRMKRNASISETVEDKVRTDAGLPIGVEGGYFVNADGFKGQDRDSSVLDGNRPPSGQPSLWCQWVPNDDGTAIEWDCGEKFYEYVPWIKYIVEHFIKPWGYILNGEVEWSGEESTDLGKIVIKDNVVTEKLGTVTYG